MLIFSISDTGLVRDNNEDYHRYDRQRQLILLADGVGGHAHGEIASRVAVESAWQYLLRNESLPDEESLEPADALAECISFANQKVLMQQRIKPSYYNMGTTLIVAWVIGTRLHYGWVGDSRLYLLRASEGTLRQLTVDHTLLQEKLEKGEPVEVDMSGHLITRMIGSMYNASPEVGVVDLADGDLLLACSDGVSDLVPDAHLEHCLLLHAKHLHDAPMALRTLVYEAGARDNLTAIVARMDVP